MKLEIPSKSKIFLVDYPYHNDLKKEILIGLETYKDFQNRQTNVKATMTEWNISSTEIENLKSFIIDYLNNCYPFVLKNNINFYYKSFWANIYRQNDYTIDHDHLFASFSTVYFLKGNKNDAPLVFTESGVSITPEEGKFVIFPAHLKHNVPIQTSNQIRITLSGNIAIKDS
jgi:hypothetical protein